MVLEADIEELKARATRSCMKTKGPQDRDGFEALGHMVSFTVSPTKFRAELHPCVRALVDAVFDKDDAALATAKADLAKEIKRVEGKSNWGPFYSNPEYIDILLDNMVHNVGRFTTHLQKMEAAEAAALGEPATVIDSGTAEAQGRQSNLFGPSHPKIPRIDHSWKR